MPRRPAPLFDWSAGELCILLQRTALNIQRIWGNYEKPSAKQECLSIQNFLLKAVGTQILSDLCAGRHRVSEGERCMDPRLQLLIYFHPQLSSFTVDKNKFTECHITPYDLFWEEQLSRVPKLISVTLSTRSTTDKILRVLALHCPLIEEIATVIPITCVLRSTCPTLVTAGGLSELTKCRHLQRIDFALESCSQPECTCIFGDKLGRETALLALLKETPIREIANFEFADLLSEKIEELPLIHLRTLSILRPKAVHITALTRLCPDLKRATLGTRQSNAILHKGAFEVMATSDLCIRELTLINLPFPIENSVWYFLNVKGDNLSVLKLGLTSFLSAPDSETIRTIGENCPRLKVFQIDSLGEERVQHGAKMTDQVSEPLFSHLETIDLSGFKWRPQFVLPVCLQDAHNIRKIKLQMGPLFLEDYVNETEECYDISKAINALMRQNHFRELRSLVLNNYVRISLDSLRRIVHTSPKLEKLKLFKMNEDYKEELCEFLINIKRIVDVESFSVLPLRQGN